MAKPMGLSERMAMLEAHQAKVGNAKCASKHCKRKGFFVCRGGCGRTFCGHCARGVVDAADLRAAEELRGTCVCYTCQPTRTL